MKTDTLHPLAADYLERLRRAARGLPQGRRRELLAEIEAHLSEAIEPGASDAQALTVLDRLGEPEAIIAAEMPPVDRAANRRGPAEWAAIILLPFGGFLFLIGWLAGVVLLWSSRAWTTRDKWIGTLVIPGGLVTAFVALILLAHPDKKLCTGFPGRVPHCTNAPGPGAAADVLGIALFVVLVAAPLVTAIYLARRAGRLRSS
jgi:hypothetical protein